MSKLMKEIKHCRDIDGIIKYLENFKIDEIDYPNLRRVSKPQAYINATIKKIANKNNWKVLVNTLCPWDDQNRWRANTVLCTKKRKFIIEYDAEMYKSREKVIEFERKKDFKAIKNGYVVIRIREKNCPTLNSGAIEIITEKRGRPSESAIREMVNIISDYTEDKISFNIKSLSMEDVENEFISDDEIWFYKAALYARYVKENKTIFIPTNYEMNYIDLSQWVQWQRIQIRNSILSYSKKTILYRIGFTSDEYLTRCDECFELAKKYYKEYGNLNIPTRYIYEGANLGKWVETQRRRYLHPEDPHLRPMSQEEIERLEAFGFVWVKKQRLFNTVDERLEEMVELIEQGFDFNIKKSLVNIDNQKYLNCMEWLDKMRHAYNIDELEQMLEKRLKEMNIILDNSIIVRRTKLLKLKEVVKTEGYSRWNELKHYKQKQFVENEINMFRDNPEEYSKEFISIILSCGINFYSEDPFGKQERKLRKLACDKGIPARIYYRFCEEQEKEA